MMKRISTSYYNYCFKNLNYFSQNALIKFVQRERSKTGSRFDLTFHRLLAYVLTDWATWKVIRICTSTDKIYK